MKLATFFEKMTREASGVVGSGGPSDAPATPPAAEAPANPGLDASNIPAGLTPPAPDYSWADPTFVEGGALKPEFGEHYQSLLADKQAREAAIAAVPEAYDFAPSADAFADLKLPEGVSLEVKRDDPDYAPLFDELGGLLKEMGAPAEAGSKVSTILARYEATRYRKALEAATKDFETLGPTEAARTARMEPIKRALETRLPADQAKALMGAVTSSAGVKALERLLSPGGPAAPASTPQTPAVDPVAARYPNSRI